MCLCTYCTTGFLWIQERNVDFTTAKEDNGYSGKWYFYNSNYGITNNAVFKMPIIGDNDKWKYDFVGLRMTAALAAVWFVYETKKQKHKQKNK